MKKTLLILFSISFIFATFTFSAKELPGSMVASPIKGMSELMGDIFSRVSLLDRNIDVMNDSESFLPLLTIDPDCVDFQIDKHLEDGGYIDFIFNTENCNISGHQITLRVFFNSEKVATDLLLLVDGKAVNMDIGGLENGENCPDIYVESGDGYLGIVFDFNTSDCSEKCSGLSGKVYYEIYYESSGDSYSVDSIKTSFDSDFSLDEFVSCINNMGENCALLSISDPYDVDGDTYYRDLTLSFNDGCGEEFPITGEFKLKVFFQNEGERTYFTVVSEEDNLKLLDPTDHIVNFLESRFNSKPEVVKSLTDGGLIEVTITAYLNSIEYSLNGDLTLKYLLINEDGESCFYQFENLDYVESENRYLEVSFDGNDWEVKLDTVISFDEIEELSGNYEVLADVIVSPDESIYYDIYLVNIDNPDVSLHFYSSSDDKLKIGGKEKVPYSGNGYFELPEIEVVDGDIFKEYIRPDFTVNFSYGYVDEAQVKAIFYARTLIGDVSIESKYEKSFVVKLPEGNNSLYSLFDIFQFLGYVENN